MSEQKVVIKNRRASYEYHLLTTYKAGIMLTGTEVKSIREGKASLGDAYCLITNGELWIKNMHISEYKEGSYNNHDPKRLRKLLIQKAELRKIQSKLREKGLTIIPTQLYFNERGYAKIDIAIAKGKKLFDKREDMKTKDARRELRNIE
jgi:SsrA-binding protein